MKDDSIRLPNRSWTPPAPAAAPPSKPAQSVFVPSEQSKERKSRRWQGTALFLLAALAVGAVIVMVYRPKPKPPDAVETVAGAYLDALVQQDEATIKRLGTVEEPPGISSHRDIHHQKARDRQIKGSYKTLAALHKKIDAEFTYDEMAGRFIPKNALGIAGETLDKLHEAKEEASKKGGTYDKMKSGDPEEMIDGALEYGKVFDDLSKTLTTKRILPTYKMLIDTAKPPLTPEAKALAMAVADNPKQWQGLLKRPFWTLKPDGPFIYDEAEVTATARDTLASLGDPPSRLRLKLVRFRLEGIDTGWKVVIARRATADDDKPAPATKAAPGPERNYSAEPAPAKKTSVY